MEKAKTATPSRRTRSSVKQVKNTKRSGTSSSDEPEIRQAKSTRGSKKAKDPNLPNKTNGQNQGEDLKAKITKKFNGDIDDSNCEVKNNSKEGNDTDNSNVSTLSEKQNIPVSKDEGEVKQCETSGPGCNFATASESNNAISNMDNAPGDESEDNSINLRVEGKLLNINNTELIIEETSKNSVELGIIDQNYCCSKTSSNCKTNEILDGEKDVVTDIDAKPIIQEIELKHMEISGDTKPDASQSLHLVTTLSYEQPFDSSTKENSQEAQSTCIKSTELSFQQEPFSNSSIENTGEMCKLIPDILEKPKQSSVENNVLSVNDGSDTAPNQAEQCNDHCPSNFTLISSDEHKTLSQGDAMGTEKETVVYGKKDNGMNEVKNAYSVEGNQSIDTVMEGGNEDVSSNILNEANNSTFVEKSKSLDTVIEECKNGISANILGAIDTGENHILNKTNSMEICADDITEKSDGNVHLKLEEKPSNPKSPNVYLGSEMNDIDLDVDSLNNTSHKKFRRRNESQDDLNSSEENAKQQEILMELGDYETHSRDNCSGDRIVIDDSSSSSTSASNEFSNNIISEVVDYNSDNLQNDIAHNFQARDISEGDKQCDDTYHDSICKQNKLVDYVSSECIDKTDMNPNIALDVDSPMEVENISVTNVGKGNETSVDIHYNCPDIDIGASENTNLREYDRTEIDISIKTLRNHTECKKGQKTSHESIDGNVELTSQLLSLNEPIPEKMSERELYAPGSDCFIQVEEPTVTDKANNVPEIETTGSNLANQIKSMTVASEPQTLVNEYNENELKEEHSDSNSDIYQNMSEEGSEKNENNSNSDKDKNMSDVGSEKDDKDGSLYDLSSSSDPHFDDPVGSEQYGSSDDREEQDPEELDEGENVEEEHEEEKEENEPSVPGEEGESRNKDAALTYDQALAILNKNRVKKIDDEEFFDLFTQELNRVSDAASGGSDSDIAIVDEYLMEPDEMEDNSNPKPPKSTLSQRTSRQNQNMPPVENFQFTQPAQHSHPNLDVSKLDYSQGLYHQYNQGIMPTMNAPIMSYDHYGPGPSNVPHMTSFNPQIQSGIHYSRPMYNPHMNSAGPMPYPRGPPIRLRLIGSQNQRNVDPGALQETAQQSGPGRYDPDGNISNATNIEQAKKNDQDHIKYSPDKSNDQNTPILNMLGLNKEKLVLLKQVLGLENTTDKKSLRDTIISNMSSPSKIKDRQKVQHEKKLKPQQKRHNKITHLKSSNYKIASKLLFKNISYCKKILENLQELTCSPIVNSSENRISSSSSSDSTLSSDDSSGRQHKSREVNLDNGNMAVKVNTTGKYKHLYEQKKKLRRDRNIETSEISGEKKQGKRARNPVSKSQENKNICSKRAALVFSNDSSSTEEKKTKKLNRKRKYRELRSDTSVTSASEECENLKKMVKTRSGTETSPVSNHAVMKSSSGAFKVDSMTEASGSESQSSDLTTPNIKMMKRGMVSKTMRRMRENENVDTGDFEMDQQAYLEKMKRSIRSDIAAGKNKLSNIFTMVGSKRPKRKKQSEESEDQARKAKKCMKLPAGVLERLTNRGLSHSETEESETSDEVERKKKKKRTKKIKVKSAATKQGYIPFVSAGTSTQFGLRRLDSDDSLAMARNAADFRKERLYGSAVRRISSKELSSIHEKKRRNDFAAQRKKKS